MYTVFLAQRAEERACLRKGGTFPCSPELVGESGDTEADTENAM